MTVFAGAIAHKVTVGGVDVSELVGGGGTFFGVSDEKISRGLIKTSGTLQIMDNGVIDLDSRTNPIFSRGAPVIIEVKFNRNGTWFRHPRGALRIIRDPAPPYPGKDYIEIEIGCLLTLLDFASPPDEDKQDEETKKQEKPRHQIINEILSNLAKEQGIPNIQLQGTIPDYPLAVEADKLGSGSYIELCGDIAFGGGHALWIDNTEKLRAVRIVPSKISHNFPDIVIGGDDGMEISYKSITGIDIPPSKYLFTAEGDPSDPDAEGEDEDEDDDRGCSKHKTYGTQYETDPSYGGRGSDRVLITEKICDRWNSSKTIRTITHTIKRAQGLVYQANGVSGLTMKPEKIVEKWYYNSDGVLYKRTKEENRMIGEALRSIFDQIPEELDEIKDPEDEEEENNSGAYGTRFLRAGYFGGAYYENDSYRKDFTANMRWAVSVKRVMESEERWYFDEENGVVDKYTKIIKEPKGKVLGSYYKFERYKMTKYPIGPDGEEHKEGPYADGIYGYGFGYLKTLADYLGYTPFDQGTDIISRHHLDSLTETYREEQTWKEFRKEEWEWRKIVRKPGGLLSAGNDRPEEVALIPMIDPEESEYILSNSGDSQPPEPETLGDLVVDEEGNVEGEIPEEGEPTNIECEVEMQAPAYPEYRPKKKEIRLEFIKNEENLCAIGHAIAALDQGRVWLHELVLPLREDIIDGFQPVGFIKIQEYGKTRFTSDDRTFIYIAEGISWTLENDSALLSMDLILYNNASNFFTRTEQYYPKLNPPPIIPNDPNDPIPPTPSPVPVPPPVPAPSPAPTPAPPIIIPKPIPVTKGGWRHGGSTQWFNFDPNTPEEFDLVAEWNYGGMMIHGDQIVESEGEYLYGSDLSEAYIPYVSAEYLWGYTGHLEQIIPSIISAEAWVGYGGNLTYLLAEIYESTGGFVYGGTSEYEDQSSAIAALNPRFWFRTDEGITIDYTTYEGISAWTNQGSAESLAQPTKSNQPQYFKVGKIDAAYFDYLTFLGLTDSGATKSYYGFTAIVRSVLPQWRLLQWGSYGQIFSYPATSASALRSYLFEWGQSYFHSNPYPVLVRKNKTDLSQPFNCADVDEWFCITVIFNPSYINNNISGSENFRINKTFENYYLGFYLAEIMVHDSALSSSDIGDVEDEMMNRWKIGVPSAYTDINSFNLYYWFRADMGLTIDTSSGVNSVSSWANQGSGEDAIQTTKVNQPLIYSDANLGDTIHFNGSSWLSNISKSAPHVFGMCAVLRSVGSTWSIFGQVFAYPALNAPYSRSYLFESGQTYFHLGPPPVSVRKNGVDLSSPFSLAPIDAFFCLTVVWSEQYKSNSIRDQINFLLGRAYEGYMVQMYVAEIAIFNDSYATTDIAKIENEMMTRWGI